MDNHIASSGDYLGFRLGAEEYGIPILKVQEIRGYTEPTRIAEEDGGSSGTQGGSVQGGCRGRVGFVLNQSMKSEIQGRVDSRQDDLAFQAEG